VYGWTNKVETNDHCELSLSISFINSYDNPSNVFDVMIIITQPSSILYTKFTTIYDTLSNTIPISLPFLSLNFYFIFYGFRVSVVWGMLFNINRSAGSNEFSY